MYEQLIGLVSKAGDKADEKATSYQNAALGGVSGILQNAQNKSQLKSLLKQLGLADEEITRMAGEREQQVSDTYSPFTQGYSENFQNYLNQLQNTDYSQYDVSQPGEFDYDLNAETQKYLNPELQAIIDRASGQVESSSANAGKLFSGATGKAIARSTADITANEFGRAQNVAQQQGQQKYQQFTDKFNNALRANDFNRGNMQSGLNNQGMAVGMQGNQFGEQQSLLNQIRSGLDAGLTSNLATRANTRATLSGQPGALGAFFQGAVGGLGG